jgi:hypothetical protein
MWSRDMVLPRHNWLVRFVGGRDGSGPTGTSKTRNASTGSKKPVPGWRGVKGVHEGGGFCPTANKLLYVQPPQDPSQMTAVPWALPCILRKPGHPARSPPSPGGQSSRVFPAGLFQLREQEVCGPTYKFGFYSAGFPGFA